MVGNISVTGSLDLALEDLIKVGAHLILSLRNLLLDLPKHGDDLVGRVEDSSQDRPDNTEVALYLFQGTGSLGSSVCCLSTVWSSGCGCQVLHPLKDLHSLLRLLST